jgi:hypothetical protein
MLPERAFKKKLFSNSPATLEGGGGGQSAPSQPTAQTTTINPIAEWAQPTATALIGSSMQNAFNIDKEGNILGSRGFTPFGGATNAQGQFTGAPISQQQYNDQLAVAGLGVAGPSALQQKSYQGAANLQMPGQFGAATGAAGLGTMEALTAGNRYNQMATNPYAQQAFMSPYIQNALQPQLEEMQRQYGITGTQEASKATQQGAFGGGREAIMQAENNRNKNMAMNQAIGQGYQNAFTAAQQAQQYGAGLGLQGAQAGIQGAGQLAGIGGQQLGAEQGILNTQNQMGTQQQQNQQNVINQAMQNYSNQQQYPQQQAANIMNLIRSTPTTQTQTMYQAPPNPYSQVAGLAATGIGAYGALKAEGGEIKEKKMASGGIASGVPAEKLPSMLAKLSDQQLAQKADLRTNDPETASDAISQQQFRANARGFAPGGIVAFAEGDLVDQMGKDQTPSQATLDKFYSKYGQGFGRLAPTSQITKETPDMMAIAGQNKDAGLAYLEAIRGARPDRNQQGYLQLMNLGANTAAGTSSNFLTNLAGGVQKTMPQILEDTKANRQAQLEEAKAGYDVSKADSATLMEIAKNADQNKEKEKDRLMHLGMSENQANATIKSAQIHAAASIEGHRISAGATLGAAKLKAVSDKEGPLFARIADNQIRKLLDAKAKEINSTVDGIPPEVYNQITIQGINNAKEIMAGMKDYKSGSNDGSKDASNSKVVVPEGVTVKKIN